MVKPVTDTVTEAGIILQESKTELPNKGIIRHRGLDCKTLAQEGDLILFNRHSPTSITLNGEDLLIFKESDIYSILKKA